MRQGGEQEEKLSLEGGMRIQMRPYEGLRLQTLPQQQLQGQVSQVQHPMEGLGQQRVNPSPRSGVGIFIDGANLHGGFSSLFLYIYYK
jgi:hypothetical protein